MRKPKKPKKYKGKATPSKVKAYIVRLKNWKAKVREYEAWKKKKDAPKRELQKLVNEARRLSSS